MKKYTLTLMLGIAIISIKPTFAMEPDDREEKNLPKLILDQYPNPRETEDNEKTDGLSFIAKERRYLLSYLANVPPEHRAKNPEYEPARLRNVMDTKRPHFYVGAHVGWGDTIYRTKNNRPS